MRRHPVNTSPEHVLQDMLALVSKRATLKTIRSWTGTQFCEAEEWASLEHLHASDNPCCRVPCPPHVAVLPEAK